MYLRTIKRITGAVFAFLALIAIAACDTGTGGGGGGTQIEITGVSLSDGTLSPAFDPATTDYTATVANAISSITVTITTDDPDLEVAIDGTAVLPGTGEATISLSEGANTIELVVSDGTDSVTYTVVVTREGVPEIAVSGILDFNADTPGVDDVDYVSGGTTVDFGTPSGQESLPGTITEITITISNTGTAPLVLDDTTPIVFSGTNADEFSVPTPPTETTIPPSSSVDIIIRFDPVDGGTSTREADASIDNNDSDENPFTFALQGNNACVTSG